MAAPFHIAPAVVNAFHRALPRWYRRHKRDLPWRRTRDPYAIWVSEIMLQQTRVETVIPYYERWLRTFPTVQSVAHAPLYRALKLWEGLGYYARARRLHQAAKMVARNGFGDLPGVGRYTAGAIASIAFGQRAAVVDGNVARVFARVFRITGNVRRPATQRRLWRIAEALLPSRNCGEFNQALMELGALVCRTQSPRCPACPLRQVCTGRELAHRLPNRGRPVIYRHEVHDVAWQYRAGRARLRPRPDGLWELPATQPGGNLLVTVRHTITNRRITLRVWRKASRGVWGRLERLPMPAAHRRAVNAVVGSDTSPAARAG